MLVNEIAAVLMLTMMLSPLTLSVIFIGWGILYLRKSPSYINSFRTRNWPQLHIFIDLGFFRVTTMVMVNVFECFETRWIALGVRFFKWEFDIKLYTPYKNYRA